MKKYIIVFAILLVGLSSLKKKTKVWLALGDSITYLNDHPNETGNRITNGYMSLICEKNKHISYINQGHNGWTAVRIAEEIDKLQLQKADFYTVFLGTNDWWQGKTLGSIQNYQQNTGTSTFFGAYRIILDKLKSMNPDAKIVLLTPMQRVDFVYINNFKNRAYGSYRAKNNQYLEQFAEAIRHIGQIEKMKVIDLYHNKDLSMDKLVKFKWLKDSTTNQYRAFPYPQFIDIPFNPETDEYPYPESSIALTYDGLHPSDAGYQIISNELKKYIH